MGRGTLGHWFRVQKIRSGVRGFSSSTREPGQLVTSTLMTSRREHRTVNLSKKLQVPAGTPIFLVDAPAGFDPGLPISKKAAGAAVLVFAANSKALMAKGNPAIGAAKGTVSLGLRIRRPDNWEPTYNETGWWSS